MSENFKSFQSTRDAYELIKELGGSDRLIQHVKLVGEAAEELIVIFQNLGISSDSEWVRLGVAFHDVGKILHPLELVEKGTEHEAAGELLLLAQNVDPKIARYCRSHGQWQHLKCSFEELVVALADNLWKGKRNVELENLVIDQAAAILDQDYWHIFVDLDSRFEQVAVRGDLRLARSI
jgi:ABC-type Fe3+-citrate transport system substrate-binding protein